MPHDWRWAAQLSLLTGPVRVAIVVAFAAGLAGLLALRRTRRWVTRSVPLAVGVAAVLLAAGWALLQVARPWPDALPVSVYAWVGGALLAVTLAVLGWRRQRVLVRAGAVLAVAAVVLGAADGVDAAFGSYPTLATALQLPPYDQVSSGDLLAAVPATMASATTARTPTHGWHAPADLPDHGAVTQVDIPASQSGFPARPAWVYVPPAYLTADRPALPLLVLLHGEPGNPRDWLDGGALAQRLDDWARAHDGLAPVVVMPDATGGEVANPLCTDSALGRADTYLSRDVVDWARAHLTVDPDTAHWAVGGFSYGGTCAMQLATAHPDLFPTVLDESGQQEPTLGSHAATVAAAFGGDEAAFDAVDPVHELAARRYAGSAAAFVSGDQDPGAQAAERVVSAAASRAGMAVTVTHLPGGHEWRVWGPGLTQALPWLAHRMGLG